MHDRWRGVHRDHIVMLRLAEPRLLTFSRPTLATIVCLRLSSASLQRSLIIPVTSWVLTGIPSATRCCLTYSVTAGVRGVVGMRCTTVVTPEGDDEGGKNETLVINRAAIAALRSDAMQSASLGYSSVETSQELQRDLLRTEQKTVRCVLRLNWSNIVHAIGSPGPRPVYPHLA
jgi:hypothetical protein